MKTRTRILLVGVAVSLFMGVISWVGAQVQDLRQRTTESAENAAAHNGWEILSTTVQPVQDGTTEVKVTRMRCDPSHTTAGETWYNIEDCNFAGKDPVLRCSPPREFPGPTECPKF